MAGALADFARRPPGVRIGVYLGIAAMLGLLYYQFALAPVRKGLKEAEANREAAVNDAAAIAQQKQQRDDLIAKQESLRERIEQNQKALPTDAEMPAFFDMLARRFNEAGVKVIRREIKPDVMVDEFVKAPVQVEITGTYYQLKQFFASLRPRVDRGADASEDAEKDRIVTVENLTVFDPRVVDNALVMTAKFTASTFRTVAPPPPAPGTTPPAAAPAPAPAAPAATPARPTPPAGAAPAASAPAATPGPATTRPGLSADEARRAAEGAYKAGEDRARTGGQP